MGVQLTTVAGSVTQALFRQTVPGVAMGAWLYRATDDDLLRLLIGGISVGFVIWHMAQSQGWVRGFARRLPPSSGLFAGLVAGFTSFVSHAGAT